MTEEKALYMGQPAGTVRLASPPLTVAFSFGAGGANRQELRGSVSHGINGLVGEGMIGAPPDYRIERIVQFQVSEPWQSPYPGATGIKPWYCDVYVLAEITSGPLALESVLMAAWMRADTELEALGDESPDVVAGVRSQSHDA